MTISGGWWELVFLGIIQGLTEFLPISSDGHLALAERYLGITEGGLAITVALHAGTFFAVLFYFRRDVGRLLQAVPRVLARTASAEERRLTIGIVVGSIPTAVIGLLLKGPTETLTTSLYAVGLFLLLSGAWNWLVVARSRKAPGSGRGVETLSAGDALAIGVVQGLAVLPGLSRSGSTIGLGVGLGLTREAAARFSFLLSLPAVFGALLLQAKDIHALPSEQLGPVFLGTTVSFFVGIAALYVLFAMLRRGRFDVFAWYCWGMGALVIVIATRAP